MPPAGAGRKEFVMRREMAAPDTHAPYTRAEVERVEREHPHASDAEKYRLMQAQRLLDWHERVWKPHRKRRRAR